MNDIERKAATFFVGLQNMYRDEDDKKETCKLEISGDTFTEDATALLLAMQLFVTQITGDDDNDLIGFTHTLNRLAIQYCMDDK